MKEAHMSRVAKFAVPLVVAGAVLGVAVVTLTGSHAQQRAEPTKYRVHELQTTAGIKFLQSFDGQSLHALVPGARGNVPLKDGDYKLTNGGAIKVEGGRIVWDAFGVVEKMKKRGLTEGPDPSG